MPKKPPADLLNPKQKGRFRRMRRQNMTQAKVGVTLKDTVVERTSMGGDVTLVALKEGRRLTRADLEKFVWRTQDGRALPITQMRDAHLMNALDMMTRRRGDRHVEAVSQQSKSHDASLAAAKASARCAQIMILLEAELLRRHPDYLGRPKVAPTGLELFALPDFYTGGVLAPLAA